tara:strand:- start:76 stop:684 length:609 start_codon:yes stop_codon:yes gene_type:complete
MANEEGNKAQNFLLNELNAHTRNDPYYYDYETGDNLYREKRLINHVASQKRLLTHDGQWYAVCLDAAVEYYEDGNTPTLSLSKDYEMPVGMISVVARIPSRDLLIPWPNKYGDISSLDTINSFWFSCHARDNRVFRCPIGGRSGRFPKIPQPGDIIEVDFEDKKTFSGPIYVGIALPGLGFMPDRPPSETGEEGEAQAAFNS